MHYITICKECKCVINQCRCPSKEKTVNYGFCKTCKEKDKNESISSNGTSSNGRS